MSIVPVLVVCAQFMRVPSLVVLDAVMIVNYVLLLESAAATRARSSTRHRRPGEARLAPNFSRPSLNRVHPFDKPLHDLSRVPVVFVARAWIFDWREKQTPRGSHETFDFFLEVLPNPSTGLKRHMSGQS